ncbi:MAG: hypothetical protein HRU03_04370 [Nanoarchaeales archaeon]|nr:hypothetical protein [Nanoarchaeales archaeon]
MINNVLEEIGLSKVECRVYLALLKLGESKSGAIISVSSVSSSKIYSVLDSLILKGLVSYKLIGKVKVFSASSPEILKSLIDDERVALDSKESKLNDVMNELNSLSSVKHESKVEYFEGFKGVRTAHNILFSKAKKDSELKYFFPYEELSDEQNLFYKKLWLDHKGLNLKARGVSVVEVLNDEKFKSIIDEDCMRFVDFPLPGTFDIIDDSLLIVSWSNVPTAVLISSKEIVKHYSKYFEDVWNKAQKYVKDK